MALPLHLVPTLEKKSLGSQIANFIRTEIVFGRLAQGAQLSQEEVCLQFGTSRMPARDALRRLVVEGYLKESPGGRLTVSKIDRNDILDMLKLEARLCGLTAYRTAERGTEQELAHIAACQEHVRSAARSKDWGAAAKANADFHRAINFACGSQRLLAALRSISLRVYGDVPRFPRHIERTVAHHDLIVTALMKRKPEEAQEIAEVHALAFSEALADAIASQDSNGFHEEGLAGSAAPVSVPTQK